MAEQSGISEMSATTDWMALTVLCCVTAPLVLAYYLSDLTSDARYSPAQGAPIIPIGHRKLLSRFTHFLVLPKRSGEFAIANNHARDFGRTINESLLFMVPKADPVDHLSNQPNVGLWHLTTGDRDVVYVYGERIAAFSAKIGDLFPEIVIGEVCDDWTKWGSRRQVPLITGEAR
jgi:hypothetical protein